jgi:hypothetical protein
LTPIYVSHTPVSHDVPSGQHDFTHGLKSFVPTEDAFPNFDFHSKLHTSIPKNIGFGAHEGRSITYEVNEAPEDHASFDEHSSLIAEKIIQAIPKKGEAYPYPLTQGDGKSTEYLFGFDPMHSSYDFTDL